MKTLLKHWTKISKVWAKKFTAMVSVAMIMTSLSFSQYGNPAPVPLLTTGTYGALASTGIFGSANVNGDVGTTTGTIDVTILPTGTNWGVGGQHNADAQTDLTAALADVSGRANDEVVADALGGLTLGRGVYSGGALALASNTTLTLNGSASDVFILKQHRHLQ